MTRFRVTAVYDIDITDAGAAKESARQVLFDVSLEEVTRGGAMEGDSESVLSDQRSHASAAVIRMLRQGFVDMPFMKIDDTRISVEPLA